MFLYIVFFCYIVPNNKDLERIFRWQNLQDLNVGPGSSITVRAILPHEHTTKRECKIARFTESDRSI